MNALTIPREEHNRYHLTLNRSLDSIELPWQLRGSLSLGSKLKQWMDAGRADRGNTRATSFYDTLPFPQSGWQFAMGPKQRNCSDGFSGYCCSSKEKKLSMLFILPQGPLKALVDEDKGNFFLLQPKAWTNDVLFMENIHLISLPTCDPVSPPHVQDHLLSDRTLNMHTIPSMIYIVKWDCHLFALWHAVQSIVSYLWGIRFLLAHDMMWHGNCWRTCIWQVSFFQFWSQLGRWDYWGVLSWQ